MARSKFVLGVMHVQCLFKSMKVSFQREACCCDGVKIGNGKMRWFNTVSLVTDWPGLCVIVGNKTADGFSKLTGIL